MPAPITCVCMSCPKCRNRERARKTYRLRSYGQWDPHGDLDAVIAHLDYLRGHRVGLKRIHELTGLSRSTVFRIRSGQNKRITKTVADAILSVQPDATLRINPVGTSRRIRGLMALGWTTYYIADRLATTQGHVWELSKARTWVTPTTAEAVSDLYDELSMTLGPSETTRRRAAAAGHVPPLAWDDIDNDPAPMGGRYQEHRRRDEVDEAVVLRLLDGERIDCTSAERHEAMRRWKAAGRSEKEMCRLQGWKDSRYGRTAA